MNNKEKYPEMWALKEELEKQKAAILRESAPLRKRYDELRAQMEPLEKELRELGEQIKGIERPGLATIDNQIGAICKGMGGKSMSNSVH